MTPSPRRKIVSQDVDDALTAPWVATGRVTPQDARLFAAALASDPALANDLAAARAEHAAVQAMAEERGRPSMRPLLALFAAIDAEPVPANVAILSVASSSVARRESDLPCVFPSASRPEVRNSFRGR